MVIFFLIVTWWTFFNMNNKENIERAQKCYEEGEGLFNQKNYKEAMYRYEEVSVIYNKPHSKWLDLAQEKEWICRAYLNDWVPPEGPLNGDMRLRQSNLFEKYKAELVKITPNTNKSN